MFVAGFETATSLLKTSGPSSGSLLTGDYRAKSEEDMSGVVLGGARVLTRAGRGR